MKNVSLPLVLLSSALAACGDVDDASARHCPAADDLMTGIVFTDPDNDAPIVHYHKALGDSVYAYSWRSGVQKNPWNSLTYGGLVPIRRVRQSGGGSETHTYETDMPALFPLQAGDEFEVVNTIEMGDITRNYLRSYQISEYEPISLGACTYDVLKITESLTSTDADGNLLSDPERRGTKLYLPELEFMIGNHAGIDIESVRIANEEDQVIFDEIKSSTE